MTGRRLEGVLQSKGCSMHWSGSTDVNTCTSSSSRWLRPGLFTVYHLHSINNNCLAWCLLAILWNSALRWVYLSFSPLPFASLLFSTICKASSDNHFAVFHFFFLGMCGERAPPLAKVMRKEAWHTQRRDQASGVSLEILINFYQVFLVQTTLISPVSSKT